MLCSIIVLTYNSKLSKIYLTLNSILKQENFEQMEVIVADDGSKNNHFEEIKHFFNEQGINNYKLISSDQNHGTVENFYKGVEQAKGRYIKGIGCGDLLYRSDTVVKFCAFMEQKQNKIAFGLMKSFIIRESIVESYDCTIPLDIKVFKRNNQEKIKRNIVAWGKLISGASMFYERKTLLNLLSEIRGIVIYCEDFVQVTALAKNINVCFLDEYVVWYEMGTGISTSQNSVWQDRIKKDYNLLYKYLEKNYNHDIYIFRRVKLQYLNKYPKFLRGALKIYKEPKMFLVPIKTKIQKISGLYRLENYDGFLSDNEFCYKNNQSGEE